MKPHIYEFYRRNAAVVWTKIHTEKQRVSSQLLKMLLLNHGDTSSYQGHQVTLKKRSLGVGVYEIWLEEEKK